jgi:hypothetical protein
MEPIDRHLYDLVRVSIARTSRGAAHVVEHCEHPPELRGTCDSCAARWEAARAVDAMARVHDEILLAADRVLMSALRLERAAGAHRAGCLECSDLATDAGELRGALALAVGAHFEASELGDEVRERHVEGAGDAPQGER